VSRKEDLAVESDLLVPAVGAVIFASDEPVPAAEIAAAFGNIEVDKVEEAIAELQESKELAGTGLCVEKVAGGYRLATRPDVGSWVRQFMRRRNRTRLSSAALETLAIVAYRQPVTLPEIQAIRGKDPAGPVKNLLDKKLLRILGKKKVVGSPLLYGTSKQFLVHFGLDSLADLPSIDEFDQFVAAFADPDLPSDDESEAPRVEAPAADAGPESEESFEAEADA
jgi:segregation and condensation protein B